MWVNIANHPGFVSTYITSTYSRIKIEIRVGMVEYHSRMATTQD